MKVGGGGGAGGAAGGAAAAAGRTEKGGGTSAAKTSKRKAAATSASEAKEARRRKRKRKREKREAREAERRDKMPAGSEAMREAWVSKAIESEKATVGCKYVQLDRHDPKYDSIAKRVETPVITRDPRGGHKGEDFKLNVTKILKVENTRAQGLCEIPLSNQESARGH